MSYPESNSYPLEPTLPEETETHSSNWALFVRTEDREVPQPKEMNFMRITKRPKLNIPDRSFTFTSQRLSVGRSVKGTLLRDRDNKLPPHRADFEGQLCCRFEIEHRRGEGEPEPTGAELSLEGYSTIVHPIQKLFDVQLLSQPGDLDPGTDMLILRTDNGESILNISVEQVKVIVGGSDWQSLTQRLSTDGDDEDLLQRASWIRIEFIDRYPSDLQEEGRQEFPPPFPNYSIRILSRSSWTSRVRQHLRRDYNSSGSTNTNDAPVRVSWFIEMRRSVQSSGQVDASSGVRMVTSPSEVIGN